MAFPGCCVAIQNKRPERSRVPARFLQRGIPESKDLVFHSRDTATVESVQGPQHQAALRLGTDVQNAGDFADDVDHRGGVE